MAAGLRCGQQQVNTRPAGGTFKSLTDKTSLLPEDLQLDTAGPCCYSAYFLRFIKWYYGFLSKTVETTDDLF